MRFSEEELEGLIDEYLDLTIDKYSEEVEQLFISEGLINYKKYSTFNENVLMNLFSGSNFNELLRENPDYVMEYFPEYWVRFIIKEINSKVDFSKLEIIEETKIKDNYVKQVSEIDLSNELEDLLQKYKQPKPIQFKYIKHKKKFLENIGLETSLVNTITLIKEMFTEGHHDRYIDNLANGYIEKSMELVPFSIVNSEERNKMEYNDEEVHYQAMAY